MNIGKRISILGLAAVCALAFSAVMAAGAVAAPESTNTAFTCSPVTAGTGEFTNADCSSKTEAHSKDWSHVAIAENEETGLELTKIGTNPTAQTKIGLVAVTFTSTALKCNNCMIHNQKEASGVMDVTGSGGTVEFTGTTINVTNCAVGPGANGVVSTKPIKVTTLSPTKVELSPVSGTVMAEVVVVNSGGTCPLSSPITVTGHMDGTLTGAILKFATGAGELLVGAQQAKLTGESTVTAGVTGGAFKPIGLT